MSELHGPYSHYPEAVQRKIVAGEVPPPRRPDDAPDTIRDLRLAVAIAEDKGDDGALDRLNAQWLDATARGETSDWEPLKVSSWDKAAQPTTRSELQAAARKAQEAGESDRANSLLARSLHAPESTEGRSALKAAAEHDEAAAQALREGDRLKARAETREADRQRVRAMKLNAGEDPDAAPAKVDPGPQTLPEINEAIAQAEAAGDWHTSNRLNARKLSLSRARRETSYDLTETS